MKHFKGVLSGVIVIGLWCGSASVARAEVSANIGVVSNYFFRGISESDDGAAVQGGLDYNHESGFYAGTWASNVDFGDSTSYELDLYLGFGSEFDNGLGYDVGYIYYAYPDAPGSSDFGEIYGSLSYGPFSAGVNGVVNDSSASALESGDLYFHVAVEVPFNDHWSSGFLVGRTDFDDGARENYTHFSASVNRSTEAIGAFSFNLEYEDSFEEDLKAWVGWGLDF
jgi:uncharacterized protein (TIGR02001 family)